jgi:hypothetical protein
MQVGYGMQPDLVEATARLLDGRTLLFAGTREWGAFIWEQLAISRALEAHGAHGRVWFDAPIEACAESWQPPMFGVAEKPADWNDDVLARLRPFNDLVLRDLPDKGDDLMVFRFGYLDCFAIEVLHQLAGLERTGATFLNPTHFAFDSKAVMAALQLPSVRMHIDTAHLATLDWAIPETHVLTGALLPRLRGEKDAWVLKFAGFDKGQQAWGGRSLQVGAGMTQNAWNDVLRRYCDLPFPVVAQRAAPTATLDVDYFDVPDGRQLQTLRGPSRIRSFFVRDGAGVAICGTHLTVSPGSGGVSESIDSVQAPVVFR